MSGGYFNREQSLLKGIAEQLREVKDRPKSVLDKLEYAADLTDLVHTMLNDIDLLLSDDIDEKTFLEDWPEDTIGLRIDLAVKKALKDDQFIDLIKSLIESER